MHEQLGQPRRVVRQQLVLPGDLPAYFQRSFVCLCLDCVLVLVEETRHTKLIHRVTEQRFFTLKLVL